MSKQKTALDLMNETQEEAAIVVATSELREAGFVVNKPETLDTIRAEFAFLKSVSDLIRFINSKDLMATVCGINTKAAYVALSVYRLFRDGYSVLERRDEFSQIGTYWESLSPNNCWGKKQGAVTVTDFGVFNRLAASRP